MAEKLKWGVVGSGGIARRRTIPEGIARASNATLVAVFDISEVANREVSQEFGAKPVSSVTELLAQDLEAVYVATPADAHYEQATECARAGKHVLCEKPLGMTVQEAEQMLSTFRDAGLQLGTGLMMRFHSQHAAALKMVQEGRLGAPTYGRAQLSCWYPPMENAWRQDPAQGGGGSLIDMGGHCIDLLEMFFGPVVGVNCFTNRTVHSYESEDSAVAMLRFANGALGTVDAFFCIPDEASKNVLELYGSKGSILAKGTIGQGEAGSMTAFLQGEDSGYAASQDRAEGGGMPIAPEPVNMYRAEIEAFSQAILEGHPVPVDGEAGLRSQKILTACYESAKSGKAIAIN